MDENPQTQDSMEDPYSLPGLNQTMDTSEEGLKVTIPMEMDEDHDSDVDSSTKMDMSDDEDFDIENHGNGATTAPNGQATTGLATNEDSMSLQAQPDISSIISRTIDAKVWKPPVFNRTPATIKTLRDLDQPVHGLPLPIWQKVACLLEPITLGRLLRVSELFQTILAPTKPMEQELRARFAQDKRLMTSEAVWQNSRINSGSGLPRPLKDCTAREMMQLIRGNDCQVCGQEKMLINTHDNLDPWHSGPGQDGLRVLYLCNIRICGVCLPQKCQQEVALQLSTTFPSFLTQALPGVYLSQHNDWIPEKLVANVPLPPHLTIRKLFYQPHIDAILVQFKEVKDLGDATVSEWMKGLEQQRQDRIDDALRWEQWEARGGLGLLNVSRATKPPTLPVILPQATPQQMPYHPPGYSGPPGFMAQPGAPGFMAQPGPPGVMASSIPPRVMQYPQSYPGHPPPSFHMQGQPMGQPIPYGVPPPMQYQPYQQAPGMPTNTGPPGVGAPQQYPGAKPRRSLQEVNEARAARRAEIERRCLLLDPPINSKVLTHIPAFQAALQIPLPFTDNDWEILQPRVVAQRETAEHQEAVLAEQLRAIQETAAAAPPPPPVQTPVVKESHELSENDWESMQFPVHKVLARLADERITEQWAGGASITHETVAFFAADILLTAAQRYYEQGNQPESKAGKISLSLESVRWLYDNRVKGYAEMFQKELFQCSGCDYNSRYYGFEGVIQHYAAKHTTALSLGNVIVNWRSDWPQVSPFNPTPGSASNGWQQQVTRTTSTSNHVEQQSAYASGNGAYQGQASTFDPSAYQDPSGGLPMTFGKQTSSNGQANGSTASTSIPMPSPATNSDTQRQQLIEMAQSSRDLWHATNGVKEMPASVRIALLIQHMSRKFESKFEVAPEIAMFLLGLNDNAQMRPIRSLNGLHCKLCTTNMNGSSRHTEKKTFTLPALVNHYKNNHLTPGQLATDIPGMDWRFDMVELPEDSVIEALIDSNGMDERKFALLTAIFPDVFPTPLPSLASLKKKRAEEAAVKQQIEVTKSRLEKLKALQVGAPINNDTTATNNSSRPDAGRVTTERRVSRSPNVSEGVVEPPGEDEYDPSRPSYYGSIVEHSGASRSAGLQKPKHYELPPGIVSLGVVNDNGQPESPHTMGGFSDRLLRHHRGLTKRPESENRRRDSYPMQDSPFGATRPESMPKDSVAADQFLANLVQSLPQAQQQNRQAYDSNAYATAYPPRGQSQVYQGQPQTYQEPTAYQPQREAIVDPRYTYPPPEQTGQPFTHQVRYADDQGQYRAVVPEQRFIPRETQPVYGAQQYVNRDRSRSPRRSIPREQAYDAAQQVYEERTDFRWREPEQRPAYYRGAPEPAYGRPADSFIGQDAQGRNVRYVAVPVDDYQTQNRGYAPPQAAAPEPQTYIQRPGEMMEIGPDGRYYMVNQPVRYADEGAIDGRYRQ